MIVTVHVQSGGAAAHLHGQVRLLALRERGDRGAEGYGVLGEAAAAHARKDRLRARPLAALVARRDRGVRQRRVGRDAEEGNGVEDAEALLPMAFLRETRHELREARQARPEVGCHVSEHGVHGARGVGAVGERGGKAADVCVVSALRTQCPGVGYGGLC